MGCFSLSSSLSIINLKSFFAIGAAALLPDPPCSTIMLNAYIGFLYGIVFLSHQVGSFLGAYLGGVFNDLYGSYDYAWYISIALSIFAGLIHLPIIEKQVARLQTT